MDEILNSKNINNVRFRMAKPQGYFTEDVEAFIDGTLKQSVAAYELKIREQEQNVTDLETDNMQLKARVSELELKATFNEGSERVSDDGTLMEALSKQSELESEIARLKEELEVKTTFANEMEVYLQQVEPYITAGYGVLNPDAEPAEAPEEDITEEEAEAYAPAVKSNNRVEPTQIISDVNSINAVEEELQNSAQVVDVNAIVVEPEAETKVEAKPEKKKAKEENFDDAVVITDEVDVHANVDLEDYEVDEEALRKAMAEAGDDTEEEEEEVELVTLPDGTVVPKGIRPEDL